MAAGARNAESKSIRTYCHRCSYNDVIVHYHTLFAQGGICVCSDKTTFSANIFGKYRYLSRFLPVS